MTGEDLGVAVIGMACNFPGAVNVQSLWRNLVDGKESIKEFSQAELKERGVPLQKMQHPMFVGMRPTLEVTDRFAAEFFGVSPREATFMDPQHRLFLECAWCAFENSGYAPRHVPGQVAVYASCGLSTYLLANMIGNSAIDETLDGMQVMVGTDKDFLATRVSYKLNLRGPSITIQSGCSSSLVAIATAVQALLTYQCDVALAGGASIQIPERTGYIYLPGGVASPDGRCRPFSACAEGTIFGDGVGAVVLKRLKDAIKDNDYIYASIRGIAINNDGAAKVGYTAPSVEGQKSVIVQALNAAMLSAEKISYVETHGTATRMGDLAELTALSRAFRLSTDRVAHCAIGSVKSNIGHLDCAAGVAGFIKTTLMLKNRTLVPTLHCEERTPLFDFTASPFYVNTNCVPWEAGAEPLRAGVSSFGIGGTNAHVILESPPDREARQYSERKCHIFPLSARTAKSLDKLKQSVDAFVKQTPCLVGDVASTLQLGREQFEFRHSVVRDSEPEPIADLGASTESQECSGRAPADAPPIAFLFPGAGCQYFQMGKQLYSSEPRYRDVVDRCAALARSKIGHDIRDALCGGSSSETQARMMHSRVGLPALFVVEYALSELLRSWGIKPAIVLGHSVGEYAAACTAGIFSLEDALELVAARCLLFDQLPKGGMVAVQLTEDGVAKLGLNNVSIAAINTDESCVLSGPKREILKCIDVLKSRGIEHRLLKIDVAAHSPMVDMIIEPFRDAMSNVSFHAPRTSVISNLTGKILTAGEACSPDYWCQQLRQPVRFAAGTKTLFSDPDILAVEMGPGQSLTPFLSSNVQLAKLKPISLLPHALDAAGAARCLHLAIARLWTNGVQIDWSAYNDNRATRIPLPTYPFESEHTVHRCSARMSNERSLANAGAQLYLPSWRRTLVASASTSSSSCSWITVGDKTELCLEIRAYIARSERLLGDHLLTDQADVDGRTQKQVLTSMLSRILPKIGGEYQERFRIIYMCSEDEAESLNCQTVPRTLLNLIALTQALQSLSVPADLCIVTINGAQITSTSQVSKYLKMLEAVCLVVPQEVPQLSCRWIDLNRGLGGNRDIARRCERIISEIEYGASSDNLVVYCGNERWVRAYEHTELERAPNATVAYKAGVYVLLGGLGGIGQKLAKALSSKMSVLIFITRPFENGSLPRNSNYHDRERFLSELRGTGCRIRVFTADVTDEEKMTSIFDEIEAEFGFITGVFHLAGITGEGALCLLSDITPEECLRQLRPKVAGCVVLERVLHFRSLEFCILFSSTSSILGGVGQLVYAAANAFVDACSCRIANGDIRWISVNWDKWGQSSASAYGHVATALDEHAIDCDEALTLLQRLVMGQTSGQVVVSSAPVERRIKGAKSTCTLSSSHLAARDDLSLQVGYMGPTTELESALSRIWADALGLDRVGIRDNLFELGASSLTSLKIAAQVRRELGIICQPTALFEAPTIKSLACLLGKVAIDQGATQPIGNRRAQIRKERKREAVSRRSIQ